MKKVTIIVAHDKHEGIGFMGEIPWRIPAEMAHFKETTMGHAVIMGRKTWDSIPDRFRPLPGRTNIVITRTIASLPGAICCKSIDEAIKEADELHPNQETFVIGGEKIYNQMLYYGHVDRILASELNTEYSADAFFERPIPSCWSATVLKTYDDFKVVDYRRKV
jgi:dihydrofolate reductase